MKQPNPLRPFIDMVVFSVAGSIAGIVSGLILSLLIAGILALSGGSSSLEVPPSGFILFLGMGAGAIIGGVLGGVVGIRSSKK